MGTILEVPLKWDAPSFIFYSKVKSIVATKTLSIFIASIAVVGAISARIIIRVRVKSHQASCVAITVDSKKIANFAGSTVG